MHHLRSKSAIYRFRLAALFWYVGCLLFPIGGGALIYSVIVTNDYLTWIAIALIILAGLMIFIQWIAAARTNCPLCIVPVLGNRGCVKNRQAQTLLGSYRMRVAAGILFHNSFRCPYCNEPTALQVRPKSVNGNYPRG